MRQKQIELWVKRDDLIHQVISGNKWRKLKFILQHALKIGSHTIISMGGAYSNHLHALAYVGYRLKLNTVGYIRGERPDQLSATLQDLQRWGMELRFVSRTHYRELRCYKKHDELPGIEEGQYWLPEGGATELAMQGIAELVAEIDMDYDAICLPCGTGATMAGLIGAVSGEKQIIGFAALKGAGFLVNEVENLVVDGKQRQNNWTIKLDYHFGGFAQRSNELLLFIKQFEQENGIELEPVYTGKMFYGLFDLIKKDAIKPGGKIIAIHTGGLQGNRA